MIAEDAESPAHGRVPRHLSGATPDTFHASAVDSPAGPTGRLSAGRTAVGLEGGVEGAAAALKPRMRGWPCAGMWTTTPSAEAGGRVRGGSDCTGLRFNDHGMVAGTDSSDPRCGRATCTPAWACGATFRWPVPPPSKQAGCPSHSSPRTRSGSAAAVGFGQPGRRPTAIFDIIESWYDLHRLRSSLGCRSPADYETAPAA